MEHGAGPTVRELIGELARIEDDLRADRLSGASSGAAWRTLPLRRRQAAVIRQLRRRRAALRRGWPRRTATSPPGSRSSRIPAGTACPAPDGVEGAP